MKRHTITVGLLAIYALIMAFMGRDRFFNPDTRFTYVLSVAGEVLVLTALYFFLRRRDRLRRKK